MVTRCVLLLWTLTILFYCQAAGFPLPYELDIRSEEELIRYYEEGYFEGMALEELLSLYRDKVNLNTATLSELKSVPYLDEKEARRIRSFCRKRVLFSVSQLLSEQLVTRRTLTLIRPFVRAGWIRKVKGSIRTSADRDSVSSRASLSVGSLKGEVRADYRDRAEFLPGAEYRLKKVTQGIVPEDWYLSWERDKFSLLAGSFKAHFAQGLAVCGGSLRSPEGLRGETGGREYFKGAAVELSRSAFQGRVLYSRFKKGEKIPLLVEEEEEYDVFDCDRVIPTESVGGEASWKGEKAEISLTGLYHAKEDEIYRLGSVGWKYMMSAFSFAGEAVTDGKRGAWQAALIHTGREIESRALFYENRGVALPLTDSIRGKLDSYWEGSLRKDFSRGRVTFSVRSYNGKEEEDDDLKYRAAVRWVLRPGITLEALRYHYQRGLYYTSLELRVKKGSWRSSVEYLLYYSRAQKIYLGLDYSRYPFRVSLDLRYGGAYGWDKAAVASGSCHLGRHLFFSARYRYEWPSPDHKNRWSVYLRTSL